MKNIFKLAKENREKIEKNGFGAFFFSASIFGVPLSLGMIFYDLRQSYDFLVFLLMMSLPTIISIILSSRGIARSLLSLRKSLLWLAFLNALLIFSIGLIFYFQQGWGVRLFVGLFFFFWINTVFFFIKNLVRKKQER